MCVCAAHGYPTARRVVPHTLSPRLHVLLRVLVLLQHRRPSLLSPSHTHGTLPLIPPHKRMLTHRLHSSGRSSWECALLRWPAWPRSSHNCGGMCGRSSSPPGASMLWRESQGAVWCLAEVFIGPIDNKTQQCDELDLLLQHISIPVLTQRWMMSRTTMPWRLTCCACEDPCVQLGHLQ